VNHLCQVFDCGWFPVSPSNPCEPGLFGISDHVVLEGVERSMP
jgi:hypothetical protein